MNDAEWERASERQAKEDFDECSCYWKRCMVSDRSPEYMLKCVVEKDPNYDGMMNWTGL